MPTGLNTIPTPAFFAIVFGGIAASYGLVALCKYFGDAMASYNFAESPEEPDGNFGVEIHGRGPHIGSYVPHARRYRALRTQKGQSLGPWWGFQLSRAGLALIAVAILGLMVTAAPWE